MKEYTYDKKSFLVGVTLSSIFCCIICVVSLCLAVVGTKTMSGLMLFVALIAAYSAWNSFVSKSNTEVVRIDDDYISFCAYNREDKYLISDIKKLRIREFPSSGKMYIRVNDSTIFKGRYWLQTKVFENGNELFRSLLDLEYKLNPDTIKARARTVNTEYMEAEKNQKGRPKRKRRTIRVRKRISK